MWNPFKPRTTDEILQNMADIMDQTNINTVPKQLPVQQSSGTIATNSTSNSLIFGALSLGLSKEEQEEMNLLKIERTHDTKKAKLLAFKKLVPEMRQFVMNALMWQVSLKEINNTTANKSNRLLELENKDSMGRFHTQATWYVTSSPVHIDMFGYIFSTMGLSDDITTEDLKQAHLEATLEEEMLDGEKE